MSADTSPSVFGLGDCIGEAVHLASGGKRKKAKGGKVNELKALLHECEKNYKVLTRRRDHKFQVLKRRLIKMGVGEETGVAIKPELESERISRLESEVRKLQGNERLLNKMASFWDSRIQSREEREQQQQLQPLRRLTDNHFEDALLAKGLWQGQQGQQLPQGIAKRTSDFDMTANGIQLTLFGISDSLEDHTNPHFKG